MSGLVLHASPLDDRCHAARLALSMIGLAHAVVPQDGLAADLPLLVDADRRIIGLPAILAHLGTRAPDWLPPAAVPWLSFCAHAARALGEARAQSLACGVVAADTWRAGWAAMVAVEDHLDAQARAGFGWIAGARPSLAEPALLPAVALSGDGDIDHRGFPAVRRWLRMARALPGFVTMPGMAEFV